MYEMEKKYKFTGETKIAEDGVTVIRRIQALKDLGAVEAGQLGGWIENEENLSHFDNCWVSGGAQVSDDVQISGNARVYDNARVFDDAWVFGNAQVSGNAWVHGDARVSDNAQVEASSDVIVITNIGSRNDATTFYKNKHSGVSVVCGCFKGTLEEFEKAVSDTHKDNKHGRVYKLAIKMAKEQIERD